jgi:ankyrin repeat protein
MRKYRFSSKRDSDHEDEKSDYEDEEGNHYSPAGELGKGNFAEARVLKTQDPKAPKLMAVLQPVEGDLVSEHDVSSLEVNSKLLFFKKVHPQRPSQIFWQPDKKSYRLVVPYLPGVSYSAFITHRHVLRRSELRRIEVFISAVSELARVHQVSLVVVDLKRDNILFDVSDMTSHIIDGGSAVTVGEDIYCDKAKGVFPQLAPEIYNGFAKASPAMDIYSLGVMLRELFHPNDSAFINNLLDACINEKPSERPSTSALLQQLKDYHATLQSFTHLRMLECDIEDVKDVPYPRGDYSIYFLAPDNILYRASCWNGRMIRLPVLPSKRDAFDEAIALIPKGVPLDAQQLSILNTFTGYMEDPTVVHRAAGDCFWGLAELRALKPTREQVNGLKTPMKKPPIYYAVAFGSIETFIYLLDQGAEVDASLQDTNLLHWAKKHGRLEVLDHLVAHPELIARFNDGTTPLHVAAVMGNGAAWQQLISIDPNAIQQCDKYGHTPAYYAAYWCYSTQANGDFSMAVGEDDWLRGSAAGLFHDAQRTYPHENIDQSLAIYDEACQQLQTIKNKTVDDSLFLSIITLTSAYVCDQYNNFVEMQPRFIAAIEICKNIPEHDPTTINGLNKAAFLKLYRYLYKKRFETGIQLDLTGSIYGLAATNGLWQVITFWTRYGIVGINMSYLTCTPLIWAARELKPECVDLLIKSGASVDDQIYQPSARNHQYTALCCAASKGAVRIVKSLLDAGANATLGGGGYQPIHLAVVNGHLACVQELVKERPYLLEQLDARGRTPLAVAEELKYTEICDYLKMQGATPSPDAQTHSPCASFSM